MGTRRLSPHRPVQYLGAWSLLLRERRQLLGQCDARRAVPGGRRRHHVVLHALQRRNGLGLHLPRSLHRRKPSGLRSLAASPPPPTRTGRTTATASPAIRMGTWVPAFWDLSDYAGSEVQLRFSYRTDGNIFGYGVYIDNVTPVLAFDSPRWWWPPPPDRSVILPDSSGRRATTSASRMKTHRDSCPRA